MKQNPPPLVRPDLGTAPVQAMPLSAQEKGDLFSLFASAERHVLWVIDLLPREQVHYVSPAFESLWGISAEALYADSRLWLSRVHPDDRDDVTTAFSRWTESPQTRAFDAEYRLVRPDGSERWVHSLGHPPSKSGTQLRRCTGITEDITARKLANAALQAEQRRLEAIASVAPSVLCSFRRNLFGLLSVPYGGARVAALFGMPGSPLEKDGSLVWERIHPDDLAHINEQLDESSRTLSTWRVEFRVLMDEGGVRWIEGHGTPVAEGKGTYLWHGTITDITGRKLSLEAVRAEKDRMAAIIATVPTVVNSFHIAPDGRAWYGLGIERVAQLMGVSEARLCTDARPVLAEIMHPDDVVAARAAAFHSAQELSLWHIEFRVRHPSRGELWIEGHAIPRREPDGGTLWYGALTDITERKHTEQALMESQRQLEAVVANMTEGLILASPDGSINEWNPAAVALHGLSDTSAQGLSMAESAASFEVCTLGGERLPLRRWPISRLLAGESLQMAEFRLRRTDIKWERVMSYSGTRVDDAEGHPQFALLQCSDVTERRRIEEEVVRLNGELEGRVAERTAELQAAVKEIEAFSYSVSHDLRAPLRALDGFSQVLLEDHGKLLPDEGRRYLGIIRSTAQKMGHLIDDLLAFSRLGRQALTRRRINCPQLVLSVFESLAPQRQGRQIEWRMGELPDCDADLALLRQVWINLLGNAIKYTGHTAQAVIEVGSSHTDGVTEYFVRDNGAGFDMLYAHKLFGVFERLHRADEFEGTGVGLAIVQRIVQRHGGQVRAQGEVGRGATFSFTLG